MHAALAVCAALVSRAASGEGTYLDVSVADGVLWLMSLAADEHLATGTEPGPGHDVLTGRFACYDTYRTADDKWLAVAAIEGKFFANLCRALGCEQWVAHQYDDDVQEELRRDLAAAFARRDRDAWVAELSGADTWWPRSRLWPRSGPTPSSRARGAVVEAKHVGHGTFVRSGRSWRAWRRSTSRCARPTSTSPTPTSCSAQPVWRRTRWPGCGPGR